LEFLLQVAKGGRLLHATAIQEISRTSADLAKVAETLARYVAAFQV
jgi:hypothetical protein